MLLFQSSLPTSPLLSVFLFSLNVYHSIRFFCKWNDKFSPHQKTTTKSCHIGDKNKLTSSLDSRQRKYQIQSMLDVGNGIENFSVLPFVSFFVFLLLSRSPETQSTQPYVPLHLKGVCRTIICQWPSICVRFALLLQVENKYTTREACVSDCIEDKHNFGGTEKWDFVIWHERCASWTHLLRSKHSFFHSNVNVKWKSDPSIGLLNTHQVHYRWILLRFFSLSIWCFREQEKRRKAISTWIVNKNGWIRLVPVVAAGVDFEKTCLTASTKRAPHHSGKQLTNVRREESAFWYLMCAKCDECVMDVNRFSSSTFMCKEKSWHSEWARWMKSNAKNLWLTTARAKQVRDAIHLSW